MRKKVASGRRDRFADRIVDLERGKVGTHRLVPFNLPLVIQRAENQRSK